MYAVFDVETTGLDAKKDRIIEISVVRLDERFETVDKYSTIVNNGKVSSQITALTGLTNDDVAQGIKEEEAVSEVYRRVRDCILVGHNVGFDLSFLYWAYERAGFTPSFEFYDTLAMARVMCRWMEKHTLNALCEEFGVRLDRHHRSLYDTIATAELFVHLYRSMTARALDLKNTFVVYRPEDFPFEAKVLFMNQDVPKVFDVGEV